MKYEKTTQEQRKSITPYLRERFEYLKKYYSSYDKVYIQAFQQAQKEEIKDIKKLQEEYREEKTDNFGDILIKKLKFESELE